MPCRYLLSEKEQTVIGSLYPRRIVVANPEAKIYVRSCKSRWQQWTLDFALILELGREELGLIVLVFELDREELGLIITTRE
jgi:hypothetical protein